MKNKFSLLEVILKQIKNEKFSMNELEVFDQARKAMHKANLDAFTDKKRGFLIPTERRTQEEDFVEWIQNRTLASEMMLIGKEQKFILPSVLEYSILKELGAFYFVPEISDASYGFFFFNDIYGSWVADDTEPTDDDTEIVVRGARFLPKRLEVCIDISRKSLEQGGPDIDNWLTENIIAAVACKLENTVFGLGASSEVRPQGMGYKITTGNDTKQAAVAPTYANIVALETEIAAINTNLRKFAYVTNPAGRRILRSVYRDNASENKSAFQDGKILDYPAHISNQVSGAAGSDGLGNLIIFGDWSQLAMCQFGAYEIIVDPYTLKKAGKVQLQINSYWDFKGLKGTALTSTGEETQPDEYVGFASLAIKDAV